jgi:hypothetical protein
MKKMVILLGCVCVWVGGLCVLVLVVMVLLMYATQRFFFKIFAFFVWEGKFHWRRRVLSISEIYEPTPLNPNCVRSM